MKMAQTALPIVIMHTLKYFLFEIFLHNSRYLKQNMSPFVRRE